MPLIIPVIAVIIGTLIGFLFPIAIPLTAAKYLSVSVLAALDSVFGGIRSAQEKNFDNWIFITGFFGNALIAAMLAYMGDMLGVDLYLAAIVAFGVRIFQNVAIIRRHVLEKLIVRKKT